MRKSIKEFINHESTGSLVLFIATLLALLFANSPWQKEYSNIVSSLQFSVNDILMPFFFLLVTLEIKRQLITGELNTFRKAILPFVSALGGILVPAMTYVAINHKNSDYLTGWAIPTATDIAFALAVLTFVQSRIPSSVKYFLVALAIIDDLGAIVIIGLFYNKGIQLGFLFAALACFLILLFCRLKNIFQNKWFYIGAGLLIWFLITASHIHSTIAGVLIGLCVPLKNKINSHYSPLKDLEDFLHPGVTYFILPLFALVNAGLTFSAVNFNDFFHPISLGIILGLLIGKPLGIFTAAYIAVKTKLAHLPTHANWYHIFGTSIICGIGFTMSLFIGILAFPDEYMNLVKLGVLTGSLLSGMMGFVLLAKPWKPSNRN